MNKPEWMPVNPCKGCHTDRSSSECQHCDFDTEYMLTINAQRKLLDWLFPQTEYMSPTRNLIKEMLKELEGIGE